MADVEVLTAQVREDPVIEARLAREVALRLGRPVRVAVPASGGCTALSLLTLPDVAEVVAIDDRPAQLDLVALKALGLGRLERSELLVLLGEAGEASQRSALYEQLRTGLSPRARAYWDGRAEAIGLGLNHLGLIERLYRDLAAAWASRGLDPVAHPRDALLDGGWHEAFEAAWGAERLTAVLGPRAAGLEGLSTQLAEAFSRVLWRQLPEENYLLMQACRGCYDETRGQMPPYLLPGGFARARELGVERLRLLEGPFAERLTEAGPFDVVATGTLSDRLPVASGHSFFDAVRRTLVPGGALLARHLVGEAPLAPLVGEHLKVDAALSKALLHEDRGFCFREVVAAFR